MAQRPDSYPPMALPGRSDPLGDLRDEHGDALVERALRRDVSRTRYGWRVAYDRSLDGDYELGGRNAYWPKQNGQGRYGWFCRCRWGRRGDMCSHILAVEIAELGL